MESSNRTGTSVSALAGRLSSTPVTAVEQHTAAERNRGSIAGRVAVSPSTDRCIVTTDPLACGRLSIERLLSC
mgnify:CR=1 FL=1